MRLLVYFSVIVFLISCGSNDRKSTTTNADTTTVISKKEHPKDYGRYLFMNHCAMCHSLSMYTEGVHLKEVLSKKNSQWLYLFLTNRQAIESDSSIKMKRKVWNGHLCPDFKVLSKDSTDLIFEFIALRQGQRG